MKQDILEVHPELRSIASKIPRLSFNARNLWFWRLLERVFGVTKRPKDILIENIHIPCQDQNTRLRLRLYRPKSISSPAPALLWLHGGGYIIGKPEQDDACCVQYTRELGLVIISVDYRRAPEYPFPGALEDSYAALQWAAAHASQFSIDAKRIAIGGASAGGGLAAALGQLAYDRKEIKPIFQMLVYPMLDDRTVIRTDLVKTDNLIWSQASNRFGWEAYLGTSCGAENLPEYAVPARRADLSGSPPTWIGVGTLDLFHDEDVAYARRLQEHGIACETVIVPGAFHGFDMAGLRSQVVQDFRNSQIAALKRCLML